MIEDRISNSLIHSGYQRIDSNAPGIYLFNQVEDNILTIISVIRSATNNELTLEQYQHVLEQMKANLGNSYPYRISLLSLVFTDNPDKVKHLVKDAGEDSHWMIDTRTNRLIIYETQANSFKELQRTIEQLLIEEMNQNPGMQQTTYNSNQSSNQGYNQSSKSGSNFGSSYPNNNQNNNPNNNQNNNQSNNQGNDQRGYPGSYPQNNQPSRSSLSRYQFSPVTMGIIALNILVYLVTHYTNAFGGEEAMLEKGALSWYYVVESKEYYRILTSVFMHANWSHLFNNMLVLLFVGGNLERAAGKIKYLFIYFGAGIIAGIASISYNMWKEYANVSIENMTISIGASGAIFGIVGAILFIVIINRGRLQEISTTQMVMFVILTLYSGIVNSNIDQAAHIGGFIGGLLLAILLYRKPKSEERLLHEN